MSVSQEHAYLELVQSSSVSSEVKETFSSWAKGTVQRLGMHQDEDSISNLLTLIPEPDDAECLPLISLSFLLSQYEGPSSTFDILRYYTRLWQRLPETVKAGHDHNAAHLMQDVLHQITKSITTLSGLFSSTSNLPALVDPSTQRSLSHEDLSCFIRNFGLPATNLTSNAQTVVLALHNGPLLGLACMAVASYYTAAPINIAGGPEQFRSDVELARPQCILTMEADIERLGLREAWVAEANIQILVIQPNADLTFDIRNLDEIVSQPHITSSQPNSPDDLALILFTSGTSGTKKVVPMTCLSLLTGVTCVIDSWGLTSEDSCVNMMPLNHVGGLVRNLFAPILAGGSTILCPAFDPNLFWDILEEGRGSWYYASPSMHMSILAEGSLRPDSLARCKLRLVCNAAGGLLPALAARLRDTFRCTVLPSYGMTECMPISTPPLGYTLDRVGTSGIGCGPEISILDESDNIVPTGQVGRINVRGGPTFVGYLKGDVIDKSAFNKDGWFDTGDLGSLDQDGYLYLTGRGKEVINRGGELISPFEVEEAITIASQNAESPLFGRVKQVLAFSAPHEVLQEVVGVALVTPPGQPRPDIRCLHRVLKSSLHQPKWPIVIVYMDALPTSNNKIVRIKFGERLGMQPITDDHSLLERHFEAVCPPVNSLLSTKIPNSPCKNETGLVFSIVDEFLKSLEVGLDAHVGVSHHDGSPEVFLAPNGTVQDESLSDYDIDRLRSLLHEKLDGFLVPSTIARLPTPFPRTASGVVDENELDEILKAMKASHSSPAASETEQTIRRAFGEVLGFDTNDISSDSEFFELGGDSLSAGRLLSILRRDMQVRIPVDQLFGASRVSELRDLVDSVLQRDAKTSSDGSTELPMPGCTETYSSTNPLVLFIHLLPIVFFYPIKMGFQWTLLMYSLSTIGDHWAEPNIAARFLALVASMFISRAITQIIAPILGILFKWVVIGKYKQGMYPMWGPYHTRWWIVQKVLLISGKGVFRHHDITRLLYYRLLGAKIGSGVTIETGTILGEYDLLEIGDNVHLDRCIVRPFAAERNTSMYLGQITIGKNSSVGLKSYVAAGSVIPEDTFIGPNSSSYEMSDNRNASRSQMIKPKTHPLLHFFCIIPIQVLVLFISSLPWMGGLWGIVMSEPTQTVDSVKTVIIWWATPHRITFHYIAQILNVAARPFVWFALVATIKKIVDVTLGPSTPKSAEQKTQKDIFKIALLTSLVPGGSLHKITKLFGTHYEFTSMAVRAMGGKVGRRVYWPGTGPTIQDFDLIEIGDDVVFGSRSHLVTSDAFGSDRVRIGSGAMIADRAVLSPGTVVEEGAVLGSGAFIPRDLSCPRDSVWVGNRKGSAICLTGALNATRAVKTQSSFLTTGNNTPLPSYPGSPVATDNQRGFRSNNTNNAITPLPSYPGSPRLSKEFLAHKDSRTVDSSAMEKGAVVNYSSQNPSIITTSDENSESTSSSPFGRAFYEGKAPYHVLGPIPIFLYSTFTTIFVQCYWNSGTISTLMLAAIMQRTHQFPIRWWRPLKIYAFASGFLSGIFIILSILALLICIVAKWSLLGRRKPGSYDWDKSSYCQRWQIFLTIETVRRRCFGGNGVIGMLTGTHWCVLYFRALGANIGKDCALFAGGRPSLTFTEPDLLTLGDRVTTDDSSLVGHINSRGNFSLNNLSVGNRSVLRSGSRLLSGATMGEDVVLLEHTLIMSGDVADDGLCYQGWPADVYRGDRLNIGSKAEA